MRRLIIEFGVGDLVSMLREPSFEKIKSMEVLSFLRSGPDETALICRVRFKNPATKIEEVFAGRFEEVQLLEQDRGSLVCFFKARRPHSRPGANVLDAGGYLSLPYEIDDGRLKVTFLGNAKEVRKFMRSIEKMGIRYKIISIMDARFRPDSPLSRLTEKQRRVILSALSLGYYDVPRRVSSEQLAKRLNIQEPTLVMHRRKAEGRLLKSIVES